MAGMGMHMHISEGWDWVESGEYSPGSESTKHNAE